MVAYPEVECLPVEKRGPWLRARWVGLSQADRDTFRQALDAADATAAVSARVQSQNLTPI